MKKSIILFALLLGLASCTQEVGSTIASTDQYKAEFTNVDAQKFQSSTEFQNAQLVDVRTAGEFAGGNISGAKNIDVNGADFAEQIKGMDKEAPVLVYCKAGARGQKAAQIFIDNGFVNVKNLDGGIMAWENAKLPVAGEKKAEGGMTMEEYEAFNNAHDIVFVDFNAEWCGPCKQMKPIVDELKKDYEGKVTVIEIDIDHSKELAQSLGIRSIPYFVINKKGAQVWESMGARPKVTFTEAIEAQLK